MLKRALLVGSLVFASCFKGGGTTTVAPPVGNTVAPKAVDYTATVADPLGFLPVDAEVILGLDVDSVRKSALWPQLAGRLSTAGGDRLRAFEATCGFDPMTTVHAITIGIKNLKQNTPDGVMVVHGLDRPQLMGCMAKAQQKGDHKVMIEDGIVSIRGSETPPSTVAFAFVDASTVVAVIGPTASKAQLQAVLAAGVPLRTSPAFNELVKLTDLESSMWMILNGSSSVFDQAASAIGSRPKAIMGSVNLGAGLTMNMRLRLEGAAQAQQFQQMINGQIGMVRAMFDKLDITTDAADIVVALAMSDQQLNNIVQLVVGQLGGP